METTRITLKKDTNQIPEPTEIIPEKIPIQTKLDLIKGISEVRSRIRKDITEDFVMAKLEDQDKEATIEMTYNAYLAKKTVNQIQHKARFWKWTGDSKKGLYGWIKEEPNELEKAYIAKQAEITFDTYMIRIYMTAILNRNKPQNYIIDRMSGITNEKEEEETVRKALRKMVEEEDEYQEEET